MQIEKHMPSSLEIKVQFAILHDEIMQMYRYFVWKCVHLFTGL